MSELSKLSEPKWRAGIRILANDFNHTKISIIQEGDESWEDIEEDIETLALESDGVTILLPDGMSKYVQAKSASADMTTGKVKIESRYIGFQCGNNIVKLRLYECDDKSPLVAVEVEPIKE